MDSKQKRQDFTSIFVLVTLLVVTNVMVPKAIAQETAPYQGLQPDEFIKTWLILGPIPVFEEKPDPKDSETQRKTFDADLLTQNGGETSIRPEPGLIHKIGTEEYRWQLVESESDIVNLIENSWHWLGYTILSPR